MFSSSHAAVARGQCRPALLRLVLHSACLSAATLLVAGGTQAQAPTPSDPITGKWVGRIGPGTTPGYAVTLDLRTNGSEVRGTMTGLDQPGDVRRGTYDAATGELQLDLGIIGQSGVALKLEGIAVEGTAVGRLARGATTGTFVLTRAESSARIADASSATIPREELKRAFDGLSATIAQAAALVPDDKYSYRPVATVRTFGQQIGHLVDAYHYYCAQAAGRRAAWSDSTALGHTNKATLALRLDEATRACSVAHASGNVGPHIVNLAHANLHYGNMVTYMRMLGITPPSSR